jgi:pilus assembly protein CpaB
MTTAIVCGLGASYMTSRLLAERGPEEATKVAVVVATKNLDTSMQLKKPEECLEIKEFTQGEEPKNALKDLESAKNKFMKRFLRKGDFVTAEDLSDSLLVLDVPPGYRAIGIRVNLKSQVGGFASLPGSKVDIISTVRRQSDEDTHSCNLLENVLVLAADAVHVRAGDSGAIQASVVTVAVTPEDALRVALAEDLGSLTLTLRRPGDVQKAERPRYTVAQLLNRSKGGKVEAGGTPQFEEPGTSVAQNPGTPPATKVEGTKPPATVEPTTPPVEVKKWVVTVVEGEHSRKVVYVLNDNGEVRQEEITETPPPLSPAPLAPPAAGPRPGTGPVPPIGPPLQGPKGQPRSPVGQIH